MKSSTLLFTAFLITTLILTSLLFFSGFLDDRREEAVLVRMANVVEDYEQLQSLLLMSEIFGEESTCVTLGSALSEMNRELWELGVKIDAYREATEQFFKDPFYQEQKRKFNSKEALYFTVLTKMGEKCPLQPAIITYFYKKKEECPSCDDQSFVLVDLKRELENMDAEVVLAVFSFDADLNLPTVEVLMRSYNVTSFPCMVIGGEAHCGIFNKEQTLDLLCAKSNISIC